MKMFQEKGHKDVHKYDFSELIDEFCTFYTGATDTSSHFITMMIYYISERP
jgi:cytochrome P450